MTNQANQATDCCPRCGTPDFRCGSQDWGDDGFHETEACLRIQIRSITSLLAERDAEVESAKACLTAYEQWEAAVIMSDEAWGGGMAPLPTITQELWDRLFEIQVMRNKVLHTTPTPKGEA